MPDKKCGVICNNARFGVQEVSSLSQKWDDHAKELVRKQKLTPFSGQRSQNCRQVWIKGSEEYAQPIGKTAERRKKANNHIDEQIDLLCYVMRSIGEPDDVRGGLSVTFGDLFQRYTRISSTLVGILIRARKRNLVEFIGEMLWQRRDDDVIITLLDQK
uniref:Costars domain-containing protein n=1 Tax=Ciona savignyi TaxID=51511 RepID=H2ZAZ8_CIOSA